MKKYVVGMCLLCMGAWWGGCSSQPAEEPMEQVVERGLDRAVQQSLLMAKELKKKDGQLPKTLKDGQLETSDYSWWCSGFFPGELWYLYELTSQGQSVGICSGLCG